MAHGIRKVNEYIVREGRALIITQDITKSINASEWKGVAEGTIYLDYTNRGLKVKAPAKAGESEIAWRNLDPAQVFLTNSIPGTLMINKTITDTKMADNSVLTRIVKDRNITSSKIALKGILDEHFEVNSLDANRLKDKTLTSKKFNDNSIVLEDVKRSFLDGSIPGAKLVGKSVTVNQLANGSCTNPILGQKAVTLDKMANASVGANQYIDKSINNIAVNDAAIDNRCLANACIKFSNMTNDSVDTLTIKQKCVNESRLADSAASTRVIANLAVTEPKVATDAITTNKIKNLNVTMGKLEKNVQDAINSAVKHDSTGKATVLGNLQVNGNIVANPSVPEKTLSVTGFKVYNPLFADYAEGFVPSEPLEVGDIVEVDMHSCVRKASAGSRTVVGVISDRYGMCLDADEEELESGAKVPVGLLGKVPVNVIGRVEPGDFIVSSGEGVGIVKEEPRYGTVVGIALESKETIGLGKVLCLIK